MDTTASLIAIVDLSLKIMEYLKEVRDGGKERSDLHKEALNVYDIFCSLKFDFDSHNINEDTPWSRAIKPLFKVGGPISQLQTVLGEITAKIIFPQNNAVIKKLKWPFQRAEAQILVGRLQSFKQTISVALSRANLQLGLDTNADVKYVRHIIESAELETALGWISSLDFRALHKAGQRTSLGGTGQWFLNDPQVRGWSEGRTKVLWCHGILGAGKTVLATTMYKKLFGENLDKNVAVLIAYCSFDDESTHSVFNILSSFIRQLTERRGEMSEAVRAMFTEHAKGRIQSRPSLEQLVNTLSAELKTLDNTFIIIDGLDELRDNAHKAQLLQTLESLDPLPQLMVTSRPVQAIHMWFTETAKPGRYRVSEQNDQAEYRCDNCDLGGDDSDDSDDGPSSVPSSIGSSTLGFDIVDANDAKIEGGAEKSAELPPKQEDEWKWETSYRCDECKRDVCVNCYEKHTVCLGCNSAKTTFRWAWPGIVIITAHLDDLERYILWRIDTSDNLKALLQNARSKVATLADQIVMRVQSESCKMQVLVSFLR